MYSIDFAPKARKQFLSLASPIRRRLAERMARLAAWPQTGLDVRPLKGRRAGEYRLRVGQYRAIFVVDEERRRILLRAIGHRGSIY